MSHWYNKAGEAVFEVPKAKGGGTRKPRKPSSTAILRRRKSRRYGQLKLR